MEGKVRGGSNLGTVRTAFTILSAVVGVGVASGREPWQFFAVFGNYGYVGCAVFLIFFTAISIIAGRISLRLNTTLMSEVIAPGDSAKLRKAVAILNATALYTAIICASAGFGSLMDQEFGVPKYVGGAVMAGLILATVLGGYKRVSKAFRYVTPVLIVMLLIAVIAVIAVRFEMSGYTDEPKPSALAPTWYISGFVYATFAMFASAAISAVAYKHAKDEKTGIKASVLGGVTFTAILVLAQIAMVKDTGFSQAMDMPILAYATRISPIVGSIYAIVLTLAIFSAGTSNFYSMSLNLPGGKKGRLLLCVLAALGYVFGLFGFSALVEYLFPATGIAGIFSFILMVINYFRLFGKKGRKGESA